MSPGASQHFTDITSLMYASLSTGQVEGCQTAHRIREMETMNRIPKTIRVSEHQNLTSWGNYHAGNLTWQILQSTQKFTHSLMHWF